MERQYREDIPRRHTLTKDDGILFLALLSSLYLVERIITEDAWFMMNCGRYVETYGIPHVDPFSFHAGLHYVMQQWLFDVFLWKLYAFTGLDGLIAYSFLSQVVILLAFCGLLWTISKGNRPLIAVISIPVSFYLARGFATQRPWTVSCLLFLCEIWLLERYRGTPKKWIFGVFFVLSALSVNVHAAMWPMLLVFLLPYAADALFRKRATSFFACEDGWGIRAIGAFSLIILLGGFLNPYGWEGMQYGLLTYGQESIAYAVTEMHALSVKMSLGLIVIPLILALTAFYARHLVPLRLVLLSAGTAFMALSAGRNVMLFMLFGFLGVAWFYRDKKIPACTVSSKSIFIMVAVATGSLLLSWQTLLEIFQQHPFEVFLYLALPILFAIFFRHTKWFCYFCFVILFISPITLQYGQKVGVAKGLQEATKIIQEDNPNAKIVADCTDGSYAGFYGIPCYYDTRCDAFIKESNWKKDYMKERNNLKRGALYYKDFLASYPEVTHVLTHGQDLLFEYLNHDPDFELIYDSGMDEWWGEYRVFKKK